MGIFKEIANEEIYDSDDTYVDPKQISLFLNEPETESAFDQLFK